MRFNERDQILRKLHVAEGRLESLQTVLVSGLSRCKHQTERDIANYWDQVSSLRAQLKAITTTAKQGA